MSLVYLDELCDSVSETFDKNTKSIVLINTSDVFNGKILNHEFVPNQNIKGQFKKLFQKNDILYSEIRPANKHYAFVDFNSKDYVASTKLMVLRPKKEKIRPKYLYYILKNKDVVNFLQGLAESRSGTFPQITFSELSTIDINLPSLENQDVIVNIVDNIEEKIECLENINKNLEELSSALAIHIFKNNDNETIELKEICKFIKGRKPKDISEFKENNFINYLTIDVLTNQNNSYAFDEKGIKANEYDILMVMDGASSGKLFYGKKGLVGSTLAKLETDSEFQEIVYQFLKINETFICENTTGTAIPHTDKGLVLNLQCPMSVEILEFSKTFKTIRSTIISNTNEINELQKLRDTLLPKLMSGEIDVSKINCYLRIKIMMKYLATFLIRKFLFIFSFNAIFLSIVIKILAIFFCVSTSPGIRISIG